MMMHKTLHPEDIKEFMCQEKKEQENSPTLKITLIRKKKDYSNRKKTIELTK